MADEFDLGSEPKFSSFVPLTILLVGLLAWFGFQDYNLNAQRGSLNSDIDAMTVQSQEAKNLATRYTLLITDLNRTAQTDETAKAILADAFKMGLISDAIKVGLIRVQQSAPATNAASSTPPAK
jgi:hypothetical protein